MAFAQMTFRESLRDMEICLSAQRDQPDCRAGCNERWATAAGMPVLLYLMSMPVPTLTAFPAPPGMNGKPERS